MHLLPPYLLPFLFPLARDVEVKTAMMMMMMMLARMTIWPSREEEEEKATK
jgi:hypothetical protein